MNISARISSLERRARDRAAEDKVCGGICRCPAGSFGEALAIRDESVPRPPPTPCASCGRTLRREVYYRDHPALPDRELFPARWRYYESAWFARDPADASTRIVL